MTLPSVVIIVLKVFLQLWLFTYEHPMVFGRFFPVRNDEVIKLMIPTRRRLTTVLNLGAPLSSDW
jgi:hypothetical protein